MVKRKIVKIDADKCNGCGKCIPDCPEGALQMIDGKARLVGDLFCDGLGACIGSCPVGAISVEERESEPYSERKVMENIVKHGTNTIVAHLEHLEEHGEEEYLTQAISFLEEKGMEVPFERKNRATPSTFCGCPGTMAQAIGKKEKKSSESDVEVDSELTQWPIQLHLVNASAQYFKNTGLLVAADCVPFAYGNFHSEFLKGKSLVIGCPKLDDANFYVEKLSELIKESSPKSITLVNMEVPCCFGMQRIVEDAISKSGKTIPLRQAIISVSGEKK